MWVEIRNGRKELYKFKHTSTYKVRMVATVIDDEIIYSEFVCKWHDKYKIFITLDSNCDVYELADMDDVWEE